MLMFLRHLNTKLKKMRIIGKIGGNYTSLIDKADTQYGLSLISTFFLGHIVALISFPFCEDLGQQVNAFLWKFFYAVTELYNLL